MSTIYCRTCGKTSPGASKRTSGVTYVNKCRKCATNKPGPIDKIKKIVSSFNARMAKR